MLTWHISKLIITPCRLFWRSFKEVFTMDHEFKFHTKTGAGGEPVEVIVYFEIDEDGVYNDNIEKILFEGVDVTGLIHENHFSELEMEASMKLREHIEAKKQLDDIWDNIP